MLVYEKEMDLRTMMKMQGLGDLSYWTINYLYYLVMWIFYMLLLIAFGAANQLNIFKKTQFGLQFCFYFLFGNMQIALSFLSSTFYAKALDSVIVNVLCAGLRLWPAPAWVGRWYIGQGVCAPSLLVGTLWRPLPT